jgi:transposase
MGAAACFHRHRAGRQLGGKSYHPIAAHPPSHDDDPAFVQSDDAAAVLAQVDAEDHYIHGSLLPLLNTDILHRRRREGRAIYKGAAKAQAIGPSRGGQTTKVHALTDTVGRPFALTLTPGNVADVSVVPVLLSRARGARFVLADNGYDADGLRRTARKAGAVPVIPGRSTRKRCIAYDRARYRERNLIQNAFSRPKDFRALPPATTSSLGTSSPPSRSP